MRRSFFSREFSHLSVFNHFILRISLEDFFRVRKSFGVDFLSFLFGNPTADY
jgi:hypothetical protein